jgi:hypothetical protein
MDEFDRLLRLAQGGALLKARALLAWKERHGSVPGGFRTEFRD